MIKEGKKFEKAWLPKEDLVVSQNRGHQNIIVPIIGTPKMAPLTLGNPPISVCKNALRVPHSYQLPSLQVWLPPLKLRRVTYGAILVNALHGLQL